MPKSGSLDLESYHPHEYRGTTSSLIGMHILQKEVFENRLQVLCKFIQEEGDP